MKLYLRFDLYLSKPNERLSLLTSRLSPNTKYLPLGITFDLGFAFGKSLTLKVPVIYSICLRFSL